MIELDGSLGEGGGQILRTSLALALLTGKPFRLRNIRARRPKPGLQPQHLMSVNAAAKVGHASLRGASIGSSDLEFHPGKVEAGAYRFDIGTAGATALVLQTVYLPLALRGNGPSEITLTGGTHVLAAPCFHFLETTWRPYLSHFGIDLSLSMRRPGFYPRGGGEITARIQPCPSVKPAMFTERGPVWLRGFSAVAGLPDHIATRQAHRAVKRLDELRDLKARIETETWSGGPGTVIAVVVDTSPAPALFFSLGERGKPADKVADEAIAQVHAFLGTDAAVDPHSADQILLPLSLSEGPSEYTVSEVTMHLLTNIDVVRRFIDREIVCAGEEGEPGVVRIR